MEKIVCTLSCGRATGQYYIFYVSNKNEIMSCSSAKLYFIRTNNVSVMLYIFTFNIVLYKQYNVSEYRSQQQFKISNTNRRAFRRYNYEILWNTPICRYKFIPT